MIQRITEVGGIGTCSQRFITQLLISRILKKTISIGDPELWAGILSAEVTVGETLHILVIPLEGT